MFHNDEDTTNNKPSSSSSSSSHCHAAAADDTSSLLSRLNIVELTDCQNFPAEHIREKLALEVHRYYDDYITIKRVGIDPEAGGTITDIDATLNNNDGKSFPITIVCQHPSFLTYSTTDNDGTPVEVSDWISTMCPFGASDECRTLSAFLHFGHSKWCGKNNKEKDARTIELSPKLCRTSSSQLADERFAKARYLRGVGRRAKALDALLGVLELDPDHSQAQQARKSLSLFPIYPSQYFSHLFDEVAESSIEARTPPHHSGGAASSSSSTTSAYHHAATAPVHSRAAAGSGGMHSRRSSSSVTGGNRSDQGRSATVEASSPADSVS
ncbi:hypothetical protein FOL47_002973 [Perkinsus chesapeaki]|uniref:Uncharacterized protein n=1 Tax=Perkinsus chesapeaki TaxID=330153 RepID=A0A7J6MA83_PERCH|nr:hypothetical protein FOL47_002973 [Perkinsus chesapeaki]